MEVGTLGFISEATVRACKKLGVWSNELRRALEDVALRASYVLSSSVSPPVGAASSGPLEANGARLPCGATSRRSGCAVVLCVECARMARAHARTHANHTRMQSITHARSQARARKHTRTPARK